MKRALINSKQGAFQTHQSSEEEMIILCHHTHRHQLRGRNTTKDVFWEHPEGNESKDGLSVK